MNKRCFVISPIGKEGSDIREHTDDVLEFIIRPAMEELNIYVYRADHTQQIGRVTDQMFHAILNEDLCIAILTGYNPNVFYELAIAQSAARPVIILIEKGQDIPFDVHDLRAVEYDLRPRPLRDRIYVNQIVEIIRSLDAGNWHVEVPFGNKLTPLGSKSEKINVYDTVESYGTSDRWLNMLEQANKVFDVTGISLRWWTKLPNFREILLKKAGEGCHIRLLLMHQDNPALTQYVDSHTMRLGRHDQVATEISDTYAMLSELTLDETNIDIRQVRSSDLRMQITRNDDSLLFYPTLQSVATDQAPLIECSSDSDFYRTMLGEFEALWNLSAPADPRTIT